MGKCPNQWSWSWFSAFQDRVIFKGKERRIFGAHGAVKILGQLVPEQGVWDRGQGGVVLPPDVVVVHVVFEPGIPRIKFVQVLIRLGQDVMAE